MSQPARQLPTSNVRGLTLVEPRIIGQSSSDPLLFSPPPLYTLPVTLGADILLTFLNQVPGSSPVTYQNFPSGTSISLVIDTVPTPIVADAVITGYSALCQVAFDDADVIESGTPWLCVVTIVSGGVTYTVVPMHGTIQRYDGLT